MVKKRKNRIQSIGYNSSTTGFRIVKTIRSSLLISLLTAILIIMASTFATSISILNTSQENAQVNFYDNIVNSIIETLNNSFKTDEEKTFTNFEKHLHYLKNYINYRLMPDYRIKDVYISDITNKNEHKLVFTTLKKDADNDFIYQPKNPHPLRLTKSSSYSVSKYPVIELKVKFKDKTNFEKSYNVYLVVPKTNTEHRSTLISQMAAFFIFMMIACSIWMSILVKSIINPLNIMQKTVSQIAKGDLSGRLEFTNYEEINRLVWSYNMMANALQKLYSSLEQKVNDRTRELKSAYTELQNTQAMMVHSEKMKSLGELVAGIMHEINNPINFIYGNMTHLSNYSKDLIAIIDEYTKYESSLKKTEIKQVTDMKTECDYEFLKTDMPDLIKSCKEGAERAKNIIQDLKSFSRMEEISIKNVDLPVEIDTVLNILHNKIKNKAVIHKEYMENVPKVEAFGGQLNQVFMNILDNAAGAIEKNGDIWIRINTDEDRNNIIIEIEDNGSGMDEETSAKVFDPFFTTKPVGQGTGLGMSISYKIIKNHQGNIRIESKKGKGTKFIITLPLNIDRESLKANMAEGEGKNG